LLSRAAHPKPAPIFQISLWFWKTVLPVLIPCHRAPAICPVVVCSAPSDNNGEVKSIVELAYLFERFDKMGYKLRTGEGSPTALDKQN
jgi:hypothetical protein